MPFSIIDDVPGFMTDTCLRFICEAVDGKEGVEIGSWLGRTTVNMLQYCKSLIAIDHFEGTEPLYGEVAKLTGEGTPPRDHFIQNVQKYNKKKTPIRLITASSERAVQLLKPNQLFDFVFLDGDHSYKGVKKDITLWRPHVRKGGLLFGHDYKLGGGGNRPGVDRAVDELVPDLDGTCASIWYKRI